jgi:uncharacterized coiled-coil protein SlyX
MGFFDFFTQIDRIESKLDSLTRKEESHMSEQRDAFTDLTAKVAKVQEVDASAITLLEGLTAKLNDLAAQLGDSPAAAEIAALATSLDASSAALAAAVVANTPAAP